MGYKQGDIDADKLDTTQLEGSDFSISSVYPTKVYSMTIKFNCNYGDYWVAIDNNGELKWSDKCGLADNLTALLREYEESTFRGILLYIAKTNNIEV